MKTCSAWCEGDRHVILCPVSSLDGARRDVGRDVGRDVVSGDDPDSMFCLSPGTGARIVAVEPASKEAGASPDADYPVMVLVTLDTGLKIETAA